MSSLNESEEQTSPPAAPGSRGVQVASSHFSKTSARSGNNGCLERRSRRLSAGRTGPNAVTDSAPPTRKSDPCLSSARRARDCARGPRSGVGARGSSDAGEPGCASRAALRTWKMGVLQHPWVHMDQALRTEGRGRGENWADGSGSVLLDRPMAEMQTHESTHPLSHLHQQVLMRIYCQVQIRTILGNEPTLDTQQYQTRKVSVTFRCTELIRRMGSA